MQVANDYKLVVQSSQYVGMNCTIHLLESLRGVSLSPAHHQEVVATIPVVHQIPCVPADKVRGIMAAGSAKPQRSLEIE